MKFTGLVLFLGCSALFLKFAVQSDLFHLQAPALNEVPHFRALLDKLELACPWMPPKPVKELPQEKPPLVIPQLSKAETLKLIEGSAAKYKVPKAFVTSIVAAESNFNCAAISPKGAIGLMQLMPDTARDFGANPAVPAENVDAGTHYLRWLMNRYQKKGSSMKRVIAAYNAGPGMVDRYRGVPPFRETRSYVARVLTFLKQFGSSRKHNDIEG